jgi:hypothetical protein
MMRFVLIFLFALLGPIPACAQTSLTTSPNHWTTASRPANPVPGTAGFNSTTKDWEFWDGTAWQTIAIGTLGAGVNCAGVPDASFATVNGIVTHC